MKYGKAFTIGNKDEPITNIQAIHEGGYILWRIKYFRFLIPLIEKIFKPMVVAHSGKLYVFKKNAIYSVTLDSTEKEKND